MNYKKMWLTLKLHLLLPYMQQKTDITAKSIYDHMTEIEEKERWNIEHKKGPPPRCPVRP